jgi:DNA repair exonuclease SbcCD ATPase subunit
MKIITVEIENFGSWAGKHTVPMSGQGMVLVEGVNQDDPGANSNGSGKSTLFDAIDWCLFGKVPRGDHVDSVINKDARQTRVEVWLDEDGHGIGVERVRGKGETSLKVHMSGPDYDEEIETLDVAETQRRLEQLLGLDRQVFHAAVLRGQTDRFNFADATQADRLDILTRILQLDEIDRMLEVAKLKATAAQTAAAAAGHDQEVLAGRLEEATRNKVTLETAAAGWEAEERARIAKRITELTEYIAGLAKQLHAAPIPDLQAQLAQLKAPLPVQPPSPDLEKCRQAVEAHASKRPVPPDQTELSNEIRKLSGDVAVATKKAGAIQSQVEMARGQLRSLKGQVGAVCPTCGRPLSGDHLAREIARLEAELPALESVYQSQDAEMTALQTQLSHAQMRMAESGRAYDKLLKAWEGDREALASGLRGWEEAAAKVASDSALARAQAVAQCAQNLRAQEMAHSYLTQANRELSALEGGALPPNPYAGQLAQEIARLVALQSEVDAAAAAWDQRVLDSRYMNYLVEALGPKGLKSYILDMQLQQLTDAANRWVGMLTGGSMMVQFVTQVALRSSKSVKNAVDIRVFRYEDGKMIERAYRSWSGGERQRVSLGIDFGLAEMVAKRATRRWDVLILDELFRHLDRSGKEAVVGMLRQLRESKPDIFVVEHDPDFADQFDKRVRVVKQGGRSQWLTAENPPSPILVKAGEVPNAVPQASSGPQGTGSPAKPQRAPRSRGRRVPVHAVVPGPGEKDSGGST